MQHAHPSWPRCACERCFAAAARAVIGGALPAIVAMAFASPAETPAPPPRAPARRKPVRHRSAKAVPPAIAPVVRAKQRKPVAAPPATERTCRVCGDTAPAGWAQSDLCVDPDCLTAAARTGRDRAKAQRAPTAARAKRLSRIARIAGKRDRIAAEVERAELADDHEDIEERLDRVPEVMP